MTAPDPQPPAAPETDVSALTEAEREAVSDAVHYPEEDGSASFECACEPVYAAVERIVAERVREVEGERDAWKSRRDAAVEQCRHLHQDGKTREQWHLDNCGAMRALADLRGRLEALADEWLEAGVVESGNYPETAVAAEDMCARALLALLASEPQP